MPVKWVLHWMPSTGATVNSHILSEISQSIESLNGVKGSRWKALLTFYKPILRDPSFTGEYPRDFIGLTFSDQPDKYYFAIRGHRLVIEADLAIQTIMEKLQSYKQRVSLNFEGTLYHLGDFQVKVGKVSPAQSENMRGIIVEVEYVPISSFEKSRQIMEEFVEALQEALSKKNLAGHLTHNETNFTEYGLPDEYSPLHTTVQYAVVIGMLIATVQSSQAMRN